MSTTTETKTVSLASIIEDQRLQMRAGGLNEVRVAEYRELLSEAKGSWPFPPVKMVHGFLCDGWHRVEAARREGRKEVPAIVIRCNDIGDAFNEALRQAAGANADHGLPRTNADKRRAVTALLATLPALTDRELGRLAKVSHTYVGMLREKPETTQNELANLEEKIHQGLNVIREMIISAGAVDGRILAKAFAKHIHATVPDVSVEAALEMVL